MKSVILLTFLRWLQLQPCTTEAYNNVTQKSLTIIFLLAIYLKAALVALRVPSGAQMENLHKSNFIFLNTHLHESTK